MKTRTSDSEGLNLQAGLATPVRLARVGVAALALTAAGMGFFGAGSASADGPQRLGQAVNTGITQSAQITQIQTAGKGNFGKVNTTRVSAAKVSATADGKWSQQQCNEAASLAEDLLNDSDRYADEGNFETSFHQAKLADGVIKNAVSNGCIVVVE
jgi:hypothetical protein